MFTFVFKIDNYVTIKKILHRMLLDYKYITRWDVIFLETYIEEK